jgi:predicted dehydrogenase
MEKLRVGVIGAGNMGERHCRVYSALPHVNFVGVSDLVEERGRLVQEKYGAQYFADFHEMLPLVDAVTISTTTPGHYPIGRECLRQGKHVLIEKPLALNLEEAQELLDLARDNERILMVGHIERYNPAFAELQGLLASSLSEAMVALNVRRLSPFDTSQTDVDVVCDLMIHDLDLVLKLTGRLPDAVETFGRTACTRTIDYAVAVLYYHEGPVVSLTASRTTQQKVRAIELTGSDCYIETDLLHKSLSIHRRFVPHFSRQGAHKYRQEGFIEQIYVPATEPLQLELSDFVQSIRQGGKPAVTGQDGFSALSLALEIKQKIEKKAASMSPDLMMALSHQKLWPQIQVKVPSIPLLQLDPQAANN